MELKPEDLLIIGASDVREYVCEESEMLCECFTVCG